jgi:ethanolamine utilization protein EutA (predicted chaperonin)
MVDEAAGGRVFFSDTGRTLAEEDQICILSAGVDIGSSTSHLVFSRIVLERLDSRYVVSEREVFFESDIMLTPYSAGEAIDAEALGRFIERQYAEAQVDPDEIDTGALILTGVAVQRSNARRIGELFAHQAGKMVAVSAGDGLETTMAAYGSGAVARSIRDDATVMNVDVGGGTSKIAVCAGGRVVDLTAVDVGARLICVDDEGRITRIENAGHRFAEALGFRLEIGDRLNGADADALANRMADCLFEAMASGAPRLNGTSLLRLPPLGPRASLQTVSFSGGVAEYIDRRQASGFGDLGPQLAAAIRARAERWGPAIVPANAGIRATVIGAAQYTTQVSGSTIYVAPMETLPLRNVPVIAPQLALDRPVIDAAEVGGAIAALLARLDLAEADTPVAVFLPWRGSATFARLDACCRGLIEGLKPLLARGHPLVLAGDGDVGGLIGIHCRDELRLDNAIVSIDGLELHEFDYIDIGGMLDAAGAVPVVIKSLVFPPADPRQGAPVGDRAAVG